MTDKYFMCCIVATSIGLAVNERVQFIRLSRNCIFNAPYCSYWGRTEWQINDRTKYEQDLSLMLHISRSLKKCTKNISSKHIGLQNCNKDRNVTAPPNCKENVHKATSVIIAVGDCGANEKQCQCMCLVPEKRCFD